MYLCENEADQSFYFRFVLNYPVILSHPRHLLIFTRLYHTLNFISQFNSGISSPYWRLFTMLSTIFDYYYYFEREILFSPLSFYFLQSSILLWSFNLSSQLSKISKSINHWVSMYDYVPRQSFFLIKPRCHFWHFKLCHFRKSMSYFTT